MEVEDFSCVHFNYWKDDVWNGKSGNSGSKNDGGGKGGNGNGIEKQP